jgi:DNA repair protein RadC
MRLLAGFAVGVRVGKIIMKNPFRKNSQLDRYELERPVAREEIIDMARRLISRKFVRGCALSDPNETRLFLQLKMGELEREVFGVIFLDNQHRVIAYEELFFGTIDGASVHPREVVKRALALNAAAVVFAHNHPSGIAEPSQADRRITDRLKASLALVDVRVLDHFIVGADEVLSFAEKGLI